jgi:hypothetical protein
MIKNDSDEKIKFYNGYDFNEDSIELSTETINDELFIKLDCTKKGSKKELYQIQILNEKNTFNQQLQKRWLDILNSILKDLKKNY